jgi:hypothetical protein
MERAKTLDLRNDSGGPRVERLTFNPKRPEMKIADTTQGGIDLSGTGEAPKTIRWFARFDMAEKSRALIAA